MEVRRQRGADVSRHADADAARRDGRRHQDTIAALREQGIVMADTDRFLTEGGRAALAGASSGILATANSDRVRGIIAGNETNEGKKDSLINLVKYGKGVPPDEPLLKVALDQQLLEIVASYLEMWPTLFSKSQARMLNPRGLRGYRAASAPFACRTA